MAENRKSLRGPLVTGGAIVLAGLVAALSFIGLRSRPEHGNPLAFQKGVVFADWTKDGYLSFASDDSIKELAKTKAEWVAVTVTWYQQKYNSTEIKATHRTPRDNGVVHVIRKAHEAGMKVMLKPHLDLIDNAGKWRSDIAFENSADWQKWFANYRDFIMHYVDIANAENVEMFCVGTELGSATVSMPDEWRSLISHIRDVYKGRLTYAANWHEEYSKIKFWDLLDYAGIDPYFPLTETKTPGVEELKKAWEPWVKQIEQWQSKIKKPVIFPEAGYKSSDAPADQPWEHTPKGELNLEAQANCYQALMETFYYKKWFWGAYWWYWQVSINPRLSYTRGFSPRGKPAEKIMSKWFAKPDPGIEKTYYLRVSRDGLSRKEAVFAPPPEVGVPEIDNPVATNSVQPVKEDSAVAAASAPQTPETEAKKTSVSPEPVIPAAVPAPAEEKRSQIIGPAQAMAMTEAEAQAAPAAPVAVRAPAANFTPVWQKGMCYMTWSREGLNNASSQDSLAALKSTGAEWVSLSPTWYQDKYNSTEISRSRDKTPSDESLIAAIKKIHGLGMKVMLKPHIDLVDQSDGHWRGEIDFGTPAEWDAWFKSYGDFILHYAGIAKDEGVEIFCVGTELTQTAVTQGSRWRKLIQDVRGVYPGLLTYAANWYDEYHRIDFWDVLDYAGVDPYFPLIEKDSPTYEEIREAWKVWEGLLEDWQAKLKKPVIFPEIGYKSSTASADQPWLSLPGKDVDLRLQEDCYRAVLEIFWNKPWFYGLYWWYWGTNPRMGGESNRGFIPQNKPAEKLIREWYAKPSPKK